MKGIFCNTKAKTNEEYRSELKRKNTILGIMALLGFITLCVAIYLEKQQFSASEHTIAFYTGVGSGILAGSLILLFRNMRTMKNEDRLKSERLKNSDERLDEISKRAFRTASTIMVVAAYLICLIGGIFYPILFKVIALLVAILMFSYIACYRYYDAHM